MSHKNEYEINNEDSVEERECSICQDVPEKVIHLSCEHIVCLDCATKLIFSDKNMDEVDLSEILCGVCNESTPLSEQVQESIIEYLNEGIQNQENFDEDENEDNDDLQENQEEQSDIEEEDEEKVSQNSESQQENEQNTNQSENEEQSVESHQNDEESQQSNQSQQDTENQEESEQSYTEVDIDIKCQSHSNEICIYYDSISLQLYCAQCLIQKKMKPEFTDNLKSIRNNYQEILHNFQELITQIKLRKNLLNNKKKDLLLRRKNCIEQAESQKKKLYIHYEQIQNKLEEIKEETVQKFNQQSKDILENLTSNENNIQEKLNYFEDVLNQVNQLQDDDECSIQDIIQYYFESQQNLAENLEKNSMNKYEDLNKSYKESKKQLEQLKEKHLKKSYEKIIENIQKKYSEISDTFQQNNNQLANSKVQQNELLKKWRNEHHKILQQKENNLFKTRSQFQYNNESRLMTPQKSFNFNKDYQHWKNAPQNKVNNYQFNVIKYKRKTFQKIEQRLGEFKLQNLHQNNMFTSSKNYYKKQNKNLDYLFKRNRFKSNRSQSNFNFKLMQQIIL